MKNRDGGMKLRSETHYLQKKEESRQGNNPYSNRESFLPVMGILLESFVFAVVPAQIYFVMRT